MVVPLRAKSIGSIAATPESQRESWSELQEAMRETKSFYDTEAATILRASIAVTDTSRPSNYARTRRRGDRVMALPQSGTVPFTAQAMAA